MELRALLKSLPDETAREAFAQRCGTSLGYMRNVSYGCRPCSPELAVAIERESGHQVTRQELRPDDWHRIWPELIGAEGSPTVPEAA